MGRRKKDRRLGIRAWGAAVAKAESLLGKPSELFSAAEGRIARRLAKPKGLSRHTPKLAKLDPFGYFQRG